jgi:hypothetical protein
LNSQLTKFIDKSDWVIDLHEGWSFHRLDPDSVGSGIYPGNTQRAKNLAQQLVNTINTSITESHKLFITMQLDEVPGSLRDHCNKNN